jgi:3-oxoacid CoA-transferase subunit A
VHLPGIFVQRVLPLTLEQATEKRIERRTVRPRGESSPSGAGAGSETPAASAPTQSKEA